MQLRSYDIYSAAAIIRLHLEPLLYKAGLQSHIWYALQSHILE